MKKILEIEMEEECVDCPMLTLETKSLELFGVVVKDHRCERLPECKLIRKNWEEHYGKDHDGCLGCRYESQGEDAEPCVTCCKRYPDHWRAKE